MKITDCFRRVRKIACGTTRATLVTMMVSFVGALAAIPAARAQIVPVRLTHEALPDSKISSRVVLLLPPRIEPSKPVTDWHKRLFFVMSARVYAAARLENGALPTLAQNLVGSAGDFDRGKSSWIPVHGGASDGGQSDEAQRRFAAH